MSEARKYLETILKLYRQNQPRRNVDASPAAYLIKHGQVWGPRSPEPVKRGREKHCYVNAYKLALANPGEFSYVEGYATAVIPVEHAWNVDREGRVIDCTPHWEKATDYFGVEFSLPTLHAIQLITEGYGALPHWQHWDEVRALLTRPARSRRAGNVQRADHAKCGPRHR